jgi:hypothetical protein
MPTKGSKMLKRSKDRKVTNLVSPNGKTANGANSFGLPAGLSCPGQTSICGKVCYAGKLEKIYSGVRDILMHNWELLKDADIPTMETLLSDMIGEFVKETNLAISKGKSATFDFRIHWDGDFFSRDYAIAWANVIRKYPDVTFWAYTRTFDVVDVLAGIDNLVLYLSADSDNIVEANATAALYNVNIATLADTFKDAKETIIDKGRKTYACPENGGRIPLISTKGSACLSCGICPKGRGDVLFSISKK